MEPTRRHHFTPQAIVTEYADGTYKLDIDWTHSYQRSQTKADDGWNGVFASEHGHYEPGAKAAAWLDQQVDKPNLIPLVVSTGDAGTFVVPPAGIEVDVIECDWFYASRHADPESAHEVAETMAERLETVTDPKLQEEIKTFIEHIYDRHPRERPKCICGYPAADEYDLDDHILTALDTTITGAPKHRKA